MYSSPIVSFFFSVNCFCLHETSAVCPKHVCSHAQIVHVVQYVARVQCIDSNNSNLLTLLLLVETG